MRPPRPPSDDPRKMAGIAAGSMIGRGWLLGLILLGAGLAAGEDVGLSAALLSLALFTVHFTFKLTCGPTSRTDPGPHDSDALAQRSSSDCSSSSG